MFKVENSIVIDRPLEEVFEFVVNFENRPQWQEGLVEIKQTPPGAVTVGTKETEVRKFLGRKIATTFEVTEFQPNEKMCWQTASGPIQVHATETFEADNGSTKLHFYLEGEAGGFFKLAEGAVGSSAQKTTDSNYARLKELLEAG